MGNRRKTGPAPTAPQNQPKISPEQQAKMTMISDKGEDILRILEDLTFAEAGMVLKTCEGLLNNKVQKLVSTIKVGADAIQVGPTSTSSELESEPNPGC